MVSVLTTAQVIAYEPDLLFSSKIESVAARFGIDVKVTSSLDELLRELKVTVPQLVLVNLDAAHGKLAVLEDFVLKRSCKTIGYYSHVNVQLAEEARRNGVDSILSRGVFAKKLEELLSTLRSDG